MAEQDRSRRDRSATEEGIALVTAALPRGPHRAATSSRQLSPPSTMRRRAPKRPTGPRSPPSATSCSAWTTTRSSRPTMPSPSAWSQDPGPASSWSSVSVPTSGQRRSSLLRGPRPPPRQGWPPCRRARGVPSRGPGAHEPPAAALPQSTGRFACRAGRPPDSDFEDHTGLQGELGFGLDRIRMALRSLSVNRDNRPLPQAVFG
jgi:hypothetical protein